MGNVRRKSGELVNAPPQVGVVRAASCADGLTLCLFCPTQTSLSIHDLRSASRMSSELSVKERLLFDQIIEEFEKPTNPVNPAVRFLAGLAISFVGFLLLLAVLTSTPAAFAACLIVTAGGCLTVHARIRLGAFPDVQWPAKPSTPPRQRYRPAPGRPHRF